MADENTTEEEGREQPVSGSYRHGMLIDSSKIKQANDDDTTQELGFLGISVFNQFDLEEGIMKQLDEESARQNAEQQRKFAEKDLRIVKKEIGEVRLEVNTLVKKIAGLLSVSVPSSSLKVQEIHAAKEVKEKQLKFLLSREVHLTSKLSSLNERLAQESVHPVMGHSDGPLPNEEKDLIESGLMTPFGTTVDGHPSTPSCRSEEISDDRLERPEIEHSSLVQSTHGLTKETSLDSQTDTFHSSTRPPQSDIAEAYSEMEITAASFTPAAQDEVDTNGSAPSSDSGEEYVPEDGPESGEVSSSSPEFSSEQELDSVDEEEEVDVLEPLVSLKTKGKTANKATAEKKPPKAKKRKKFSKHLDDGDLDLYRARIRKWKAVEALKEIEGDGQALKEPDKDFKGGVTVPGSIWSKLYPYQQTGVHWLWELHQQEIGGIVGDEMGLGKTIQMIAFLAALKVSNIQSNVTRKMGLGPVLIASPATVMHQWVQEFHTWWPQFRVAILHNTGTFTGSKKRLISEVCSSGGVLLTTYEGLRIYRDSLLPQSWEYVVLDEGHKIRNPDAEVTLVCKQFFTPHRIILSGSPMQNSLKELWSLFDFVFPGKLGTLPVFMSEFSVPIVQGGYANASQVQVETAYRCACVLRDSIKPYLLRRVKADVKLQLPKKSEQVLFCRLTAYQRELYEDFLRSPEVETMLSQRLRTFSGLTILRKLCNHPDLVAIGNKQATPKGAGTVEAERWNETIHTGGSLVEDECGHWTKAGKMVVVEALLRLWAKQKHRVLLFTQTKQMLNVLEQFVVSREYVYKRMDGTTAIAARQPLIAEFNSNADIFVFLLTTRVGGVGVNLTGANRVIIYDPDWNPSTDTQARERAWRIGQTKPVTIYRLLTAGTIEEKIYHRQIFKQYLTNRVLKDPRQRRLFKSNDLMDLFSLTSDSLTSTTETSSLFAGTGADVKSLPARGGYDPKAKKGTSTGRSSGQTSAPFRAKSSPLSSSKLAPKDNLLRGSSRHSRELSLHKNREQTVSVLSKSSKSGKGTSQESNVAASFVESYPALGSNNPSSSIHDDSETNPFAASKRSKAQPESPPLSSDWQSSAMALSSEGRADGSPPGGICTSAEQETHGEEMCSDSVPTASHTLDSQHSQKHAKAGGVQSQSGLSADFKPSQPFYPATLTNSNQPSFENTTEVLHEQRPPSSMEPLPGQNSSLKHSVPNLCTTSREMSSSNVSSEGAMLGSTSEASSSHDSSAKHFHKSLEDIRKVWNSILTSGGQSITARPSSTSEVDPKGKLPLKRAAEMSKKKTKKKLKFIEVEGSVINGVERKSAYLRSEQAEEVEEDDEGDSPSREYGSRKKMIDDESNQSEKGILAALFDRGGLHSAMHHESVVQSGLPDYVLVEAEAKRVAERAARALQQSRQDCRSASRGTPTWTGQHGSAGISLPRFGSATVSGLAPSPRQPQDSAQTSLELFGKKPVDFAGKKEELLSVDHSSDLLAKMRARNTTRGDLGGSDIVTGNTQTSLDADVSLEHRIFLRDLRDFVALRGCTNGQATTDEILQKFSKRVPPGGAAMFKSLLNQICTFFRENGRGVWKLKEDYR